MDKKHEKLVERYIDGEKTLFQSLIAIKLDGADESIHAKYLQALLSDNMKLTLSTKKLIVDALKVDKKKIKPSFKKKESKEHKPK